MYLVQLSCYGLDRATPFVVCDTMEKAQEWINNKLLEGVYSGIGSFTIKKVDYYK